MKVKSGDRVYLEMSASPGCVDLEIHDVGPSHEYATLTRAQARRLAAQLLRWAGGRRRVSLLSLHCRPGAAREIRRLLP
jgi:hypothetical protein